MSASSKETCGSRYSQLSLADTSLLRTPVHANTDSSQIPGYGCLTETNSRSHGLSLLRTYGHFVQSQLFNFIVLTLVISGTVRGSFYQKQNDHNILPLLVLAFVFLAAFTILFLVALNKFIQSVYIVSISSTVLPYYINK